MALPRRPTQSQVDAADLRGASLAGVRLAGLDLSNKDLTGAVLRFADLRNTRLEAALLEGADLRDVDLDGARLEGAHLARARMERVRGDAVDLQGADLSEADLTGAVLPGARLAGARLDRAVARSARLEGATMTGASLRLFNARGAALDGCRLDGASLDGAELRRATLENADCSGASFAGASLQGAALYRARLDEADFTGAQARGLKTRGAVLSSPQELALTAGGARVGPGWWRRQLGRLGGWLREGGVQRVASGVLSRVRALVPQRQEAPVVEQTPEPPKTAEPLRLEPGVDLSGEDLRGEDLRGVDLRGANLRGARLDGMDLAGAVLDGAVLRRASLLGARLRGASLRGADLSRASLHDAALDAADLEDANLEGAFLLGARMVDARLAGANLRDSDLSDADLSGLSLSGVDLRGARLDAADLRGADLTGVLARPVDLAGAVGVSLQTLRELDGASGAGLGSRIGARIRAMAEAPAVQRAEAAIAQALGRVAAWLRQGGLRSLAARLWDRRPRRPAWMSAENARRVGRVLLAPAVATGGLLTRSLESGADAVVSGVARVGAAVVFRSERPEPVKQLTQAHLVPGADLSGRDLRRFQLEGIDLRGADLSGARLEGCSLAGTVLAEANLSGAWLTRCVATGADFTGARMSGLRATEARFDGARLVDVDAERAVLRGSVFEGAMLSGARLVRADLGGADLREVDLTTVDLGGASLDQADLSGARWVGARVEGADVAGAIGVSGRQRYELTLRGARGGNQWLAQLLAMWELAQPVQRIEALVTRGVGIASAWVRGGGPTRILRALATPVQVLQATLRRWGPIGLVALLRLATWPARATTSVVVGLREREEARRARRVARQAALLAELRPHAQLAGRDLRKLDLAGRDLSGADLQRARLDGVDLSGTVLIGANLSGARLRRAHLNQTDLSGCWLDGARLDGAELEDCDLQGVEGERLRLSNARLRRVDLQGARLDGADLSAARLVEVNLRSAELSGARLNHAVLEDCDLDEVIVEGASFVKARGLSEGQVQQLYAAGAKGLQHLLPAPEPVEPGPGVDLSGEDLRGMDLSGRDLSGADLTGARLEGAVLERADLSHAVLDGARLRAARLEGASLVGVRADGASFDDARMSGADLTSMLGTGASLVGASLSRARMTGAVLVDADLGAAVLPDADLTGADLRGAQFDQAELAGANLTDAKVEGADFEGALGLENVLRRELGERGATVGLFELPTFTLPKVSLPKFSLPKFSLPKFSLPKLSPVEPPPELIAEEPAPEVIAEEVVPELIAEEPAPEVIADVAVPELIAEEPVLSEDSSRTFSLPTFSLPKLSLPKFLLRKPSPEESSPELVAEEPAPELIAEEVVPELIAEEPAPEVIADVAVPELIAEEPALPEESSRRSSLPTFSLPKLRLPSLSKWTVEGGQHDDLELQPGADLTGRDLRFVDLSGVDLTGANLAGARLEGTDLRSTILRDADLTAARLQRADLQGTDLRGAILDGADLGGALLEGAVLDAPAPAPQPRTSAFSRLGALVAFAATSAVRDEDLVPGVELRGADLRHLDLRGVDLHGADLRGARLDGMDLTGTRLAGCHLEGARLTRATLQDTDLSGVRAAAARFSDARFLGATLDGLAAPKADFRGASLGGATLRDVNLRGVDLRDASLASATLVRVDLSGARLRRCDLEGVSLEDCTLEGASVVGAVGLDEALETALAEGGAAQPVPLRTRLSGLLGERREELDESQLVPGAALAGMDLRRTELRGRDLSGANLRGARLDGMDLRDIVLAGAVLDGANLSRSRLLGADLRRARAEGTAFDDARLDGATLDDLKAPRASLVGASLARASLVNAVLVDADLSSADLEAADLTGAVLEGTQLDQAVLSQAILTDARLEGADLQGALGLSAQQQSSMVEQGARVGGLNIKPAVEAGLQAGAELATATGALARRLAAAIPRSTPFDVSRLVPGGNLAGEDLRRQKLAGLDLSGANLSGARLDGQDLRKTALARAVLDRANLSRARLEQANLRGASALGTRFDGANLTGADLSTLQAARASLVDVDLRRAVLDGAVFGGADLSAANLADVDLRDADLRAARLDQADLAGANLSGCAVDDAELAGALGLSLEQREALSQRGAQAGGLPSLGRLVTTSRAAQLLAAALMLAVVGYALSELAEQSPEVAVVVEEQGADAALSRYEAQLDEAGVSGDRVLLRYEMASVLSREGRLEEAEEALLAALAEAEGDDAVEVRVRLGELRLLLGDLDGAEQVWSEALEAVGAPAPLAARALIGLADLARDVDGERAARALEADWRATLERNPGRVVDVSVAASARRVASGAYEDALALLDPLRGLELAPDERTVLLGALAELHVARGDLGEADRIYTELLAQPGAGLDRGHVLLAAATVASTRGDLMRCLELLDELEREGTHPRVQAQALLLRARVLRDTDPDLAVALYSRVMQEYASDRDALGAAQLGLAETLGPDAQRDMANDLLGSGDDEQAGWMLLSAARRLRATGDHDGARALYDEVIGLNAGPDLTQTAWRDLAELEIGLGDVDAGIKALRAVQAELEGAERVEVQARIADALLAAGRLQNAEEAYQTLVDGYPPGSEAAIRGELGLAVVAEARGDMEQARAGYERILATTTSPTVAGEAQAALAGNLLEAGEPDQALAAWRAFLNTLPEGHEAGFDARLAVAEILRGRGERQAALVEYQALLDTATTPVLRTQVRLAVAELLEESGRHEDAAEAYIDLLDDPLTPLDEQDYVRVGLVRTWLSLGEPETALAVAREVKLTDTGSKRLMTQLEVQALRALGRDDEADAFGLELAVEEEDDEVSQAMAEANALLNEWDFEGSIRAYETLLPTVDDRPTQAAIDTSIAQALALSGDLDSARSRYGRVLRVYRDDPEAVFGAEMGLAWLLRMDGDPEGAIDRYERLVPPDPGSAVWRDEQLARAFVESGQPDEAEALYKRMLDEHAGDRQAEATARSGLAELLQANDELRAARALYTWVADNAPDSTQRSWASLHAAMLLVDEGQLDVAEEALDDLLDHEDPEVQLQAAVGLSAIELERGRPRRGLDVLDEVDPDTLGGAWVATWNLQRTSCLLELGRPDEARQGWEEVLNRYADNDDVASQARLALGDVALGQDRSDDAIDWYLEVLETTPDRHYQARALLGLVQAGQTDRCEQALSYEEQGELLDVARIYCD